MAISNFEIVRAALETTTAPEADELQRKIKRSFGEEFQRPVGDRPNNHGLMSPSGGYDLKLIELVTNMQDSVLERHALQTFGHADHVPFATPRDASAALLGHISDADKSRLCDVRFFDCDPSQSKSKSLTVVFRDQGRGLRPSEVPRTIFGLGGSHKESALFLQGAFGLGGTQTYGNAQAIVLVTRHDPALLPAGVEDRIAVAVVQWAEKTKGRMAYYLVNRRWQEAGDSGEPWSCPALDYPNFMPGTHVALISYGADGLHRRRQGDEKSFDVVANTRLFEPILPIRFTDERVRAHSTTLRGLRVRLENAARDFEHGEEVLPFRYEGQTYHLPITYSIFEKPRTAGGRDKFVAKDHAVLFTSNGQVHHHWQPYELRQNARLNKLYDRLLVVVETDELPIRLRTRLFTADRTNLVRGEAALSLEDDVRAFIRDWESLREANNRLIRESYQTSYGGSTLDVARRISRAFSAKGFALHGGEGNTSGGAGRAPGTGTSGGGGGGSRPVVLHDDPTLIAGPLSARAESGRRRSLTYVVDVVDSFYDGRGELLVECDHPEIGDREITVGKGRSGKVRVNVAVPESAEPGVAELRVVLDNWLRHSGGMGARIEHVTKLEIVDEIEGTGSGAGKPTRSNSQSGGAAEGEMVAFHWTSHHLQEDWERVTVGSVEPIPASVLAEQEGYEGLRGLGDLSIPSISLNSEYPPFKKYMEARSKDLGNIGEPRDRYAVGVGVSLLAMQDHVDRLGRLGQEPPDDALRMAMAQAAARGVLAVMPMADEIFKEAGLTE